MSQVVIGDVLPYTQAIATLNQTVFGTNWTANASSDVVVYRTPFGIAPNDDTQLLSSSAYTIAFIGAEEEVQVTLGTPAGAGDVITITRNTPADRLNLYTNTNFIPSMLNMDFGTLTLINQQAQLVNQLIAPRYNYTAIIQDVIDTILPVLEANETWVKNAGNTAIETTTLPPFPLPLIYGGLNAELTASNGGIFYSTATAGAILSGTSTAQQVLLSGLSSAPSWSNAVYPVSTTVNQLLYSPSTNTISGLSTANSGILKTDSGGVPSISTTLPATLTIPTPIVTTPTITGRVSGSTPSAGNVGQIISSVIPIGSAVSLTNSTPKNITSISLTAGNYIIWGNVRVLCSDLALTLLSCGISIVSNTLPATELGSILDFDPLALLSTTMSLNSPSYSISITSTITYYLVSEVGFSSGTCNGWGGLYALRVS